MGAAPAHPASAVQFFSNGDQAMNTYLIIKNGIVVNAIVWDGNAETWQPPAGQTSVLLPAGSEAWLGWSYNGTTFTAPA